MEWIERRAGLIGLGAIVVAAIALGVAIAGDRGDDRRILRVAGHGFAQPYGAPGFEGGPLLRRFGAGPGMMPPGDGFTFRRFDSAPGRLLPGRVLPELAPGGGALHGELTMPAPNGKTEVVDVQRGTVTNISASSLTVRSSDGFTKTYTITKSFARGLAKGDQVEVRATVKDGKATVTSLGGVRRHG
jgi:hypothetical protein